MRSTSNVSKKIMFVIDGSMISFVCLDIHPSFMLDVMEKVWDAELRAPLPLPPVRVYCSFKQSTMPCGVPVPMYLPAGVKKRREGHFPQLTGETAKTSAQRPDTNFWTADQKANYPL